MGRNMEKQETLSPAAQFRASNVGMLAGILLVVWAVVFSLFKSSLSPLVYWWVLFSVGIMIVAVPSWLAGQRARREHLEKQTPSA